MNLNSTYYFLKPALAPAAVISLQDRLAGLCLLASLLEQVNIDIAERQNLQKGKVALAGKLLVVLADDDCDDRELFAEVISEISDAIEVKAVENGLHLMRILNETKEALPAIIFLDLNMPGKNGRECLLEIKNNPRFSGIPVVIYSTSVNQRDIRDTHGMGANLYVPKPNSFKELIAVITKVLSLDFGNLTSAPPMNQFVISA